MKKLITAKQLKGYVETMTPQATDEFLTVITKHLPAWFDGSLQSHHKIPMLPGIELSAPSQDVMSLVHTLVGLRAFTAPEAMDRMYTAFRDKKELTKNTTLQWKSPLGPLSTWVPDAVLALTGPDNRGRSTITTLLEANLPETVILADGLALADVADWVKTNRAMLLDKAGVSAKQAVSRKPAILSTMKELSKTLRHTKPCIVFLGKGKTIPVTVIGSWNAAGG